MHQSGFQPNLIRCSWSLTGEQKGNDLNQKQAWFKIVLSVWLFAFLLDGSRKNKIRFLWVPTLEVVFSLLCHFLCDSQGSWKRIFQELKEEKSLWKTQFALTNLTLFSSVGELSGQPAMESLLKAHLSPWVPFSLEPRPVWKVIFKDLDNDARNDSEN